MKRVVKRVLFALLPAIALPAAAAGNSVASVVVSRDGHVFSDYIQNRIWEFTPGNGLRLRIPGKHTHHLDLGEDVPPDRRWPSLWRMTPDGTVSNAGAATGAGPDGSYPGTVFLAGRDGGFEYLKECRVVRLSSEGRETPVAGNSCPERAWKEDALRYGHLHGSLVRGRDGIAAARSGLPRRSGGQSAPDPDLSRRKNHDRRPGPLKKPPCFSPANNLPLSRV